VNLSRHCIKLLSRPSIDERERELEGLLELKNMDATRMAQELNRVPQKDKKQSICFLLKASMKFKRFPYL